MASGAAVDKTVHDRPRRRRTELGWAAVTAALVALASALPLLAARDWWFRDDSEIGAYPIWYRIGEALRDGGLPLLDPSAWMAGNPAAEGQWGLFNPLIMAIGLAASVVPSALVLTTLVKVGALVTAGVGVHLLARTYGVRPPLAVVAGVAVPLNGFTLYVDGPSWVTGLITWALLPWAWALLRRTVHQGRSPAGFLVVGYLITTTGYVHGFLALGVVVLAVAVDRLVTRDWRAVGTAVAGGVLLLLLGLAVFLPGILTAEVTDRTEAGIRNTSFLTTDLGALLTTSLPTAMTRTTGWWGDWTTTPLLYSAWFLPVLAFVQWSRVRPHLPALRDVAVVGTTAVLFVVGPSDLGPLRFPVRVMPYVALAVVLATVLVLDRGLPARPTGRRLAWAGGLLAGLSWFSWSQRPDDLVDVAVLSWIAVVAALAAAWAVLRSRRLPTVPALSGLLVVGSLAAVVAQTQVFPPSALPHFDVPGRVADYRSVLSEGVNDGLVVGTATREMPVVPNHRFDPDAREVRRGARPARPFPEGDQAGRWREVLIGNSWYLSGARVQNLYSAIGHEEYKRALCMNWRGETCPELLQRLFRPQPRVFVPLVDLLQVDTLLILKDEVPAADRVRPPDGWSVADEGETTVTWVRDDPVGPTGGVVWTSAGTEVQEVSRDERTVSFRVDDVPAAGGSVVLSRLDWPGYEVDGAELDAPLNGYLLRIAVPADAAGEVVTVRFTPPAWGLSVALVAGTVAAGALWSAGHLLLARRRSRRAVPAVAAQRTDEPAAAGDLAASVR